MPPTHPHGLQQSKWYSLYGLYDLPLLRPHGLQQKRGAAWDMSLFALPPTHPRMLQPGPQHPLATHSPAQVATPGVDDQRGRQVSCRSCPRACRNVLPYIMVIEISLAAPAPAHVATAHIQLQLFTVFVRKRPPGLLWAGSLPFRRTLASVAQQLCPGTSRPKAAKSAHLELATGLEPVPCGLQIRCSTN